LDKGKHKRGKRTRKLKGGGHEERKGEAQGTKHDRNKGQISRERRVKGWTSNWRCHNKL